MIVVQTRYGTRRLFPPTTPPTGGLEQVAGLLVHHAARTDTGQASRLLARNLKVTARGDQDLRALRSDLGGLARQSPIPEVVTQAVALVETVAKHPAVLDRVRLVHASSSRREVHYDVDAQLARAVAQLKAVGSAWDGRLQRIKQLERAARLPGARPAAPPAAPGADMVPAALLAGPVDRVADAERARGRRDEVEADRDRLRHLHMEAVREVEALRAQLLAATHASSPGEPTVSPRRGLFRRS